MQCFAFAVVVRNTVIFFILSLHWGAGRQCLEALVRPSVAFITRARDHVCSMYGEPISWRQNRKLNNKLKVHPGSCQATHGWQTSPSAFLHKSQFYTQQHSNNNNIGIWVCCLLTCQQLSCQVYWGLKAAPLIGDGQSPLASFMSDEGEGLDLGELCISPGSLLWFLCGNIVDVRKVSKRFMAVVCLLKTI